MTYEDPTPEALRKALQPGAYVEMRCRGPVTFRNECGYVGLVREDSFIFRLVMNSNEHFSNDSAPAETESHTVRFKDIIWIDVR